MHVSWKNVQQITLQYYTYADDLEVQSPNPWVVFKSLTWTIPFHWTQHREDIGFLSSSIQHESKSTPSSYTCRRKSWYCGHYSLILNYILGCCSHYPSYRCTCSGKRMIQKLANCEAIKQNEWKSVVTCYWFQVIILYIKYTSIEFWTQTLTYPHNVGVYNKLIRSL